MSGINTLSLGVLCVGLVGSGLILSMAYNSPTQNTSQAETVVPIEERSTYVLRIYDSRVGIFRGNAQEPYSYLDLDVACLSDYDKGLLTSGIEVSTDAELQSLIEDLTS
jgi:hypothetical protein